MSIATRLKQFGVSLESAELPVSSELPEVQYQPVETVEAIIDLDTTHGETEQVAEDMQTVFSAQDQLTEIATGLESMAAGKGMSKIEYRMTQHAINGAVRGLGMRRVSTGLESFDGSTAKMNAVHVSMEDVKDKLKAAGLWIKEMVSTFIEMAKQFALKIFSVAGQLKSKATALKARAENAEGRQNGKVTIPANAAGNLSLGQSYVGDVVAASGRLVSLVEAELDKLVPAQNDAVQQVAAALKQEGSELGDAVGKVISAYQALPGVNWKQDGPNLTSDELLGGYGYTLNPETAQVSLTRVFPVLEEDTEVPALAGSKVITVCDNIIQLAETLAKAKGELESRMKEAARIQSLPGGLLSDASEGYVQHVRMGMRVQLALLKGSLQQLSRYCAHSANSMLVVCDKSLLAYEPVGAVKALPA